MASNGGRKDKRKLDNEILDSSTSSNKKSRTRSLREKNTQSKDNEDDDNSDVDLDENDDNNRSMCSDSSVFNDDSNVWSQTRGRNYKRRKDKSFKLPDPVFFKYPVIIQDLCTGSDTYKNYGAATNQIWKLNKCGAIISQKRCKTANKWMLECNTFSQQQTIAQMTKIKTDKGIINVKAEIPLATTEGVIGPLNREWSEETVESLIKEGSSVPIQRIQRLKKNGEPCSAVKIVFLTEVLPETIKVGTQFYCVEPFRKTILRCMICQN